jgi:site-specific DNA-methyltransferase (adenine-specific)
MNPTAMDCLANGAILFRDDCFNSFNLIENNSVDLILCDLPYGRTQNKKDIQLPLPKLWGQYKRVIKENGAILLFADGMFMADLMYSNQNWWRYNLVWDKVLKTGFLNANRMPLRQHEEICVFYKKLPTYNPQFSQGKPLHGKGTAYIDAEIVNNNYGEFHATEDTRKGCTEKYPSSILTFTKPHPSVAKHPTEKPVELLRYLIRTYSNKGDVVLDNCMGSGSCGIAAMKEGRKFIGIEKDSKYFDIAEERIAEIENVY